MQPELDDGCFHSKSLPGRLMNRYGVVLHNGAQVTIEVRAWVVHEAMAAGWTLEPSGERDTGNVWFPPEISPK